MQRLMILVRRVAVTAILLALAGCASKAVITASSTYRDQMADVFTALDELIGTHTDVWRQRRVLQWQDSPAAIARAAGFDMKMLGSDAEPFHTWVCNPSGEAWSFALGVATGYVEGLAGVSKAPGEGLTALGRAITQEQKRINDLKNSTPDLTPDDKKQQTDKCGKGLDGLYASPFSIPLTADQPFLPPPSTTAFAAGPALDFAFALYDALVTTAQLIEQEKRAELIEAYVKANRKRVDQALAVLERGKDAPSGLRIKPTLQEALQDRMRFHLTVALVNVANANSGSAGSARQEAAERAARHIALYRVLSKVNVDDDLLTPMREAHNKFVDLAEHPRGNFDDFMDAVAKLRATRDKWVDVRDKYRAWRD